MNEPLLTLGPVLFAWKPADWRDFYFRIADEAAVDEVYVGEIVCIKRAPALDAVMEPAIERLTAAGKTVIRSSPLLVTAEAERTALAALC